MNLSRDQMDRAGRDLAAGPEVAPGAVSGKPAHVDRQLRRPAGDLGRQHRRPGHLGGGRAALEGRLLVLPRVRRPARRARTSLGLPGVHLPPAGAPLGARRRRGDRPARAARWRLDIQLPGLANRPTRRWRWPSADGVRPARRAGAAPAARGQVGRRALHHGRARRPAGAAAAGQEPGGLAGGVRRDRPRACR